ncbi:MAG: FMN-binding negative transcriptional regulator [Acidimicrobiales bacterium]
MYTPPSMVVTDEAEVRAMVDDVASAWLVTVAGGEPVATLVPIVWDRDRVLAHVAKANPQWRSIEDGARGLMIVGGPEAYVSPGWYVTKREHGKVVPTWNYTAVHLSGALRVHHDRDWLLDVVSRLTERHEASMAEPWAVTDAPAEFVDGLLGAIVGVELAVDRVEAKAKLSQNRPADDRAGVVEGLSAVDEPGAHAIARAMRHLDP